MRAAKVLHVIPSVGPLRGGPSTMVRQLAAQLVKAGVETHIATTNDNGPQTLDVPKSRPVQEDGVTYWYFPRQLGFYTFSWPLGSWLAAHVADFDVIHIHALFSFATLPAAFWSRRRGVPYIVRPLGTLNRWGMRNRRPWLKKASFRLLESRIVRNAALMHYTSEQERREAESLNVRTASVVIPNALPPSTVRPIPGRFREKFGLQNKRIVLFLSRLDEKKGIDLLLRAFAMVRARHSDAVLVIAGDGDPNLVRSLKEEADRLDLHDIVWTGFLTGADKASALAEADVFALPSHSENFGIAVVEAMAAGVPVIVSDQVAIHGEIASARSGLVVPCDSKLLADALWVLLADPKLGRDMGARGRAFVQSRYSPESVTRQLISAYQGVLGR